MFRGEVSALLLVNCVVLVASHFELSKISKFQKKKQLGRTFSIISAFLLCQSSANTKVSIHPLFLSIRVPPCLDGRLLMWRERQSLAPGFPQLE